MKKLLSLCLGIALLGATAASPAVAAGITDIDAVTRVFPPFQFLPAGSSRRWAEN